MSHFVYMLWCCDGTTGTAVDLSAARKMEAEIKRMERREKLKRTSLRGKK